MFILHLMIVMTATRVGRNQFSFANETVLYLNPIMWINLIKRMGPNMHLWLLVIEQFVLFQILLRVRNT